jgi:hypothetical protein
MARRVVRLHAQADGSRLGLVTGHQTGRNVLKSGGTTLEICYQRWPDRVRAARRRSFVRPAVQVAGQHDDRRDRRHELHVSSNVQYVYLAEGGKDFQPLGDITLACGCGEDHHAHRRDGAVCGARQKPAR